jgi:hypothetical protein
MSLIKNNIQKAEYLIFLYSSILLIYSLILTIFSQSGFPQLDHAYFLMPYISDKIIGEDGYYMLGVAWNIAQGKGISYNFGEATTGIQPLATFLYALIAKIVQYLEYDKFVFARWIFFSNSILFLYFSHLIGKLSTILVDDVDKKVVYLVAFSLGLFNLVLFRHFTYGLETGLYLVLFTLTLIFSLTRPIDNLQNIIIFGVLIGLTGLARIDFGMVFLVFLLFKVSSNKECFFPLILTGIVALIIISPWFIYVHQVSGHWIPSSGGAQSSIFSLSGNLNHRIFIMMNSIGYNAIPFIYGSYTILSIFALLITITCSYLLKKYKVFSNLKRDYKYWLYGVITLIIVYVIAFWATHFYARYSSPIVLFTIPIFSILIVRIIPNMIYIKRLIYLCIMSFFIFSLYSNHRGGVTNSHSISAGYILENYPDKIIGAFQSGVIGYFNSNVYNLDGKVDHVALEHLKVGNIHKVISQKNIDVIIDWKKYIQKIDDQYLKENFILVDSLSNHSYVYIKR